MGHSPRGQLQWTEPLSSHRMLIVYHWNFFETLIDRLRSLCKMTKSATHASNPSIPNAVRGHKSSRPDRAIQQDTTVQRKGDAEKGGTERQRQTDGGREGWGRKSLF